MVPKTILSAKDIEHLLPYSKSKSNDFLNITNSFQEFKEAAESAFIKKQLDDHDWNISKTAEVLGIQRSHLYNKIKKYNLEKKNQ